MKFRTVPVEQRPDILTQRVFRPSDERAPVVLGLLPEYLDHIKFGAVGREITKKGVVLDHPTPGGLVIQTVMDARVIQNDKGGRRLGDEGKQSINEGDEDFSIDRASDLLVVKSLTSEIKGAHDRDALMVRRRDRMRLANQRPSPLHGRRCRKAGFIVVEQLTPTLARPVFETGKFRLAGGKSYGVPVFFRLNRVRLKLNPLARSLTLSVSREHGSGH